MLSNFKHSRRESGFSEGSAVGGVPFRSIGEPRGSFCLIVFDRPNKVYWSGDTLSGKIIIVLQTEKTIRGMFGASQIASVLIGDKCFGLLKQVFNYILAERAVVNLR